MSKIVVVVSGGLDSATLLWKAQEEHIISSAVSFNYGQRHKKELEFASAMCEDMNVKHHIIDLSQSGLTEALAQSGSSLVDLTTDVPEGHYAEDNMKSTVVPNRNMIMLSMAIGIAVSEGANAVATGVHAGDHFIYPDCRPGFILNAALAGYLGNEGFGDLWRSPIWAPFINKTKADIAYDALVMGLPLERTWSCYKGGDKHCGVCGTCVERLEAIDEALKRTRDERWTVPAYDSTEYEDSTSWRSIIESSKGL